MQRATPPPLVALVALLIAALVPALALGALTPLSGANMSDDPLGRMGIALLIFYPVAAGFSVAFGVPSFLLFRRLGILS